MSQISIQDIAAGIDRRFWSPRRLNALFMSQVMKDGETMRNLIHGGDQAASDAVLQALIAYYESRDKGQLIERMAQIGLDYPFIGFWKQRQDDKNRDESQPLREELETMKRRKVLFIQLSQIRLLAKKFAIVILFLSAFVMMLINKTDTVIIEKTSSMATDVVSPLIDVLVVPARTLAGVFDYFRDLSKIYDDNRKLRAENNRLQIVSDKARALEIENKLLAKLLNYTPPPNAKFVTARVIAEEGDAFSHSIIAYTGRDSGVKKGQVVMSDNGVIGRVDKPGKMYSKIILITDINSKIPVMVERTRVRGILSGDNTTVPKMIFIPLSAKLTVGDRIITSGVAGVFPPGLPIGKISSIEKNSVKIKTFGNLDRLEYVKIIDYGLDGEESASEETPEKGVGDE